MKSWFNKRKQAFTDGGRRFGLRPPKGVVLVGVPGCGKSLSAKALAQEWDVPLLRLDMAKIFTSYLGASEANMRKALHIAEAVSPCVLWIDELEKAFSGGSQNLDSGASLRVLGFFLEWLNEKTAPVFVVATANAIHQLPDALLRKGRFDDVFFVDLPEHSQRKVILAIHLQRRNRDPSLFDLQTLASLSQGFTGAEIEESIISALYLAFEDNARALTTDDVVSSINEIKPLFMTRKQDIDAMRQRVKAFAKDA
jgi:SpoVK/Ycf46/Vps4 family AAA+-type ATPase